MTLMSEKRWHETYRKSRFTDLSILPVSPWGPRWAREDVLRFGRWGPWWARRTGRAGGTLRKQDRTFQSHTVREKRAKYPETHRGWRNRDCITAASNVKVAQPSWELLTLIISASVSKSSNPDPSMASWGTHTTWPANQLKCQSTNYQIKYWTEMTGQTWIKTIVMRGFTPKMLHNQFVIISIFISQYFQTSIHFARVGFSDGKCVHILSYKFNWCIKMQVYSQKRQQQSPLQEKKWFTIVTS